MPSVSTMIPSTRLATHHSHTTNPPGTAFTVQNSPTSCLRKLSPIAWVPSLACMSTAPTLDMSPLRALDRSMVAVCWMDWRIGHIVWSPIRLRGVRWPRCIWRLVVGSRRRGLRGGILDPLLMSLSLVGFAFFVVSFLLTSSLFLYLAPYANTSLFLLIANYARNEKLQEELWAYSEKMANEKLTAWYHAIINQPHNNEIRE